MRLRSKGGDPEPPIGVPFGMFCRSLYSVPNGKICAVSIAY